jgi:hypothetical protein
MLRTVGAEGGVKLLASSGSKGARWLVEW